MNYSQEYVVRLNRQFYPQEVQFHVATKLFYLRKPLSPFSRIIEMTSALGSYDLGSHKLLAGHQDGWWGSGVDQEEAGRGLDVIEIHCPQFSKN